MKKVATPKRHPTLLEQARKITYPDPSSRKGYSQEELELAYAFFHGLVSSKQVGSVMRKSSPAYWAMQVLLWAIREGGWMVTTTPNAPSKFRFSS